MKGEKLYIAIAEARRFLDRAEALASKSTDYGEYYGKQSAPEDLDA